jgi:hypothetical protein
MLSANYAECVIMLSVVLLNVVMLSVVAAPCHVLFTPNFTQQSGAFKKVSFFSFN